MADTSNKVGIFTITAKDGDSIIDQIYTFTPPSETDLSLAGASTVTISEKAADLTVKIPIVIQEGSGKAASLPFSGPATLSIAPVTANTLSNSLPFAKSSGACTVKDTTFENLVQMEDHILFKVKQTYVEEDTCKPEATTADGANLIAYWLDLAPKLATDAENITFSIMKLGCHQQSGSDSMRCVGGYKIPAGVTDSTEASLKVFKATDKITSVNVTVPANFPIRKSGSMGAAVVGASTATCAVTFVDNAYKFSYTNKGDDEVICIFEATYTVADAVEAYVYKASDGIAFTTEHVSVTSDDKTKLALSAGYLNSSWPLLTIILIIGGVLVVAVVLIFWWFRPSDREPEEDD